MQTLASVIAIAAFLCYMAGLFLVLAAPWYLLAMLARLVRREATRGSWTNVLLYALLLVCVLSGMIWSWAEDNASVRQAEAKSNLGAIYALELAYFNYNNVYADDKNESCFNRLGWLEMGTYYFYFCGTEQKAPIITDYPFPQLTPANWPSNLPRSKVSATGFTIVAIGNLDRDEVLDVWTINDANVVVNVVNDVNLPNLNPDSFLAILYQQLYGLKLNPLRATAAAITPLLIISLLRDWRRSRRAAKS